MSTDTDDAVGVKDRCILVLIGYLKRNDYTSIREISDSLIKAKDGTREVYLWVDYTGSPRAVPLRVVDEACREGARVDVIGVKVTGDVAEIRHVMNAVAP